MSKRTVAYFREPGQLKTGISEISEDGPGGTTFEQQPSLGMRKGEA